MRKICIHRLMRLNCLTYQSLCECKIWPTSNPSALRSWRAVGSEDSAERLRRRTCARNRKFQIGTQQPQCLGLCTKSFRQIFWSRPCPICISRINTVKETWYWLYDIILYIMQQQSKVPWDRRWEHPCLQQEDPSPVRDLLLSPCPRYAYTSSG